MIIDFIFKAVFFIKASMNISLKVRLFAMASKSS